MVEEIEMMAALMMIRFFLVFYFNAPGTVFMKEGGDKL
jgi:hypothetical protein